MKVKVDRDLCIGVANCVVIAGAVFRLDAEKKAVVIDQTGADDKTLMEAAENCPVNAVILEMMPAIRSILDKENNQYIPLPATK